MLRFTKAAGTGLRWFRRFFYVLFEGYFTWLCTFALMAPTPSPIYVLKIGIGHKHNMVWCEINMQWLPFPCEEQSPTLRGSEAGRGDTHDGTCGWTHGGTMAGREAGCQGARHLLRRRAKAHRQGHTSFRQGRRRLRSGVAGRCGQMAGRRPAGKLSARLDGGGTQ